MQLVVFTRAKASTAVSRLSRRWTFAGSCKHPIIVATILTKSKNVADRLSAAVL